MVASHHRDGRPHASMLRASIWLALFSIAMLCSTVQARSVQPPPLKRLHEPRAISLQILPRTPVAVSARKRSIYTPPTSPPPPESLLASDQLRLTLNVPTLDHPLHLHLKPTEHLFHPEATYTTFTAEGEEQTVPLFKDEHRVYTGHVIHPDNSARYWALSRLNVFRSEKEKHPGQLGTARIMVHNPGSPSQGIDPLFEGVFEVNGMTYHILTKEHYARVRTVDDVDVEQISMGQSKMVIFRDADLDHPHETPLEHSTCSHDTHPFNANASHPVWNNAAGQDDDGNWLEWMSAMDPMRNFKRDDIQTGGGSMSNSGNFINSIGNDAGCPNEQRIVYMGVAADCNYVQTYGGADQARTQILNDWNSVSALYKSTFNISLGIISLIVQNETCPSNAPSDAPWNFACTDTVTLDQRLSIFSQWRGTLGDDGAGLWHLMSACATDSEVGVAWLGTLCTTSSTQQSGSFVSGTGVSTAQKTEWSLVSHEIGHGFGAIHDCTSSCSLSSACCPLSTTTCNAGGQYIMNPTTNTNEVAFSPCSVGNICSNLNTRSVGTSCIVNPGSQTVISLQQCGNGIVEDGEDCDPGSGASSACCDSATCKFTQGSVCDPNNSGCCTSECQLASNGTVCRPSIDSTCDFQEVCTGNSSACPDDRTADDGTSCGGDLFCASGQCTSLDRQCQAVGASLNLQESCSQKADTSCTVTCQDPDNGGQCLILQTPLIDGSPCGYGGRCYNQTCAAGSTSAKISSWYRQNLQISIPVTIVVGIIILIILFMLLRCIFCGCGPRKKKGAVVAPRRHRRGHSNQPPPMSQFNGGPLPPPPSHPNNQRHSSGPAPTHNMAPTPYPGQYDDQRQSWNNGGGPPPGGYAPPPPQSGGWVDPSTYNGPNYNYQQEQQQYGQYR